MYEVKKELKKQDIIARIKANNFYIYGNGYIGKRLYEQIKRMGCSDKFVAFAVTDICRSTQNNNDVYGVVSINEVPKDSFVIIAAHDANAIEMKNKLIELGINKYIWIYPYMLELELGYPIRTNCLMSVKELLNNIRDDFMPAIYYYSLKDYCEKKKLNGSLYVKMSTHYVTLETGIKRWERFCRTIEKSRRYGFKQEANIYLDENNILIDGLHRLVLAKYFGTDTLLCDIYCSGRDFYSEKGIGGSIYMHEEDLEKYFNYEEIQLIKIADKELRE